MNHYQALLTKAKRRQKIQDKFTMWTAIVVALLIGYGYGANIHYLTQAATISGMEAARILGIIFFPLGAVLGYV